MQWVVLYAINLKLSRLTFFIYTVFPFTVCIMINIFNQQYASDGYLFVVSILFSEKCWFEQDIIQLRICYVTKYP